MGRSALWLLAVAGCLDAGLVPCGDKLCPSGSNCVAGELCASTDQVAACTGLAEGDTCSVGASVGRCDRGVCVASGCGNLVLDPGEACDDGNVASGDGCHADCRKLEACGDAILDDGEGCDDGNRNPADGCDACTPTIWRATAVVGGTTLAIDVSFTTPHRTAVDLHGNLYVADLFGRRVYRVDATGVITVVAGNGASAPLGDGGPATSAAVTPGGLAVDGLGNLYITDTHRIRRVDPTGIITTIAGTGVAGYNGDSIAATSADLRAPADVAVDGFGNVYIADSGNGRIRRVDLAGTITTVAASLASPRGIAIDPIGRIVFADTLTHRVRRIEANGALTVIAGTGAAGAGPDGPAISSALDNPNALAIDSAGRVYVADLNNHRVRRIDTSGMIVTLAGTGSPGFGGDAGRATDAILDQPTGVATFAGQLYIADKNNRRVRRIDTTNTIDTIAGSGTPNAVSGDGGAATSADLQSAYDVVLDALGNVYFVADHAVRRIDIAGTITTIAGTGIPGFDGDNQPGTAAQLSSPTGIALDASGRIYVADLANHRIRRIDTNGTITTIAGTGVPSFGGDNGPATLAALDQPADVAVDAAGNVYVADLANHRIRRIDGLAQTITTIAGTGNAGYFGDDGPATAAWLSSPRGVTIDDSGRLWIADTGNHVIRVIDTSGTITTEVGVGTSGFSGDDGPADQAELSNPFGVALDAMGTLYIADAGNQRVRRVAGGEISTIAGGGAKYGDAFDADEVTMAYPTGIAIGSQGIYVAESGGARLRRIDAQGKIWTACGPVDPAGMGPIGRARLVDPRALVVTPTLSLIAGGESGVVQAMRAGWVVAVAGRYPSSVDAGALARFRAQTFGSVGGVTYDEASATMYFAETSNHRLHAVTVVDPDAEHTWTIATLANAAGLEGFADGSAGLARFRMPTGLHHDAAGQRLYIADSGNHVIRAVDLANGIASATTTTIAGVGATRGFFGDGGVATAALLHAPQAVTRCPNGDLFVADAGNHRVRRIASATGTISTVLGDGVGASSGEGPPAAAFPVDHPLGLACDATGNLFVTSTTTVRLLPADDAGVVDGSGAVRTIYGALPRDTFPASVTSCLTGIAVVDATTVQVVDGCTGMLVELRREPVAP